MVELTRDGEIFVLTMRGGENRIDGDLLAALHGALDEVEASEGPAALHEALVTGRRYAGPAAAERGLVNEACAEGELLPRAVALARELAGKDRATMAAIKRGIHGEALAALTR